ncbi:MAG TPA: PAS domain S-box protein, partial [Candidatus Competibacter sp.]|nr:PAS domain S-box protein [Candidatus Competibacter sp.]
MTPSSNPLPAEPVTNIIFWIDPESRILDASEGACCALGYDREALLKLSVRDVDPEFPSERWPDHWRELRQVKVLHFRTTHRRRDGSLVPVEVTAHHVELDGREYNCALVRVITPQRRTETALRESEGRLALALAVSGQGLYDLNITTGQTVFSDEYARMLGHEPSELELTPAMWASWLHPEEREEILQLFEDCVTGKRSDYRAEFRLRTHAGEWIWVRSIGKIVEWDAAGRPVRMIGTHLNIAEQKRAEEALKKHAQEMQWLMRSMANAFVIWGSVFDANGRYIDCRFAYFNDAYEKVSGLKLDEVQGKTVLEIWPATEPSWFEVYGEVAVTGNPKTFEMYHAPTEGLYACNAYRPWDTTDRICVVFEDITDRKAAETQLRYHLDLEQAQAEISALMIKPGWEDFDARVNWALERIGCLTQADRSYLFTIAPDGSTASNTHEWCAQGVHPQIQGAQNLPLADYQPFYDWLRRGEAVSVRTAVLSDGTALKTIMLAGDVRSLLCVPISWGGTLRGFAGFDAVTTERTWLEEEIRLLRMVAEIIAHTLQHIESDHILCDNARFLENLDRVSRILARPERDADLLTELATTILDIFQADRAFFLHPCDPGAATFHIRIEATRPEWPGVFASGAEITPDGVEIVPDDAFRRDIEQTLRHHGPVLSDFAGMSEAPSIVRRHSIRTHMTIALRPQLGQPWVLGIHQCAYDRRWTDAEQRLFHTIAERVSDALSGYLLLKQIQESEERFAKVFHASPAPMIISVIETGCCLDANDRWLKLLGYSREEVIGHTSKKMNLWVDPEVREQGIARLRREGCLRDAPVRFRTKTGAIVDVLWSAEIVRLGAQEVLLTLIYDITERKRTESELQRHRDH